MNCILCKKETTRNVKGIPCCKDCIKEAQEGREKINLTRTSPQSRINTEGESPITLREVILKVAMEKEKQSNESI